MKTDKLSQAAALLNKAAPPGERLAFVNPREERGLKAAGGMGKPSAGGVPSYKKGDVDAPPERDYGNETRQTLLAQIDLADELYDAESTSRSKYADLDAGIAERIAPRLMDLYEKLQPRFSAMDRSAASAKRESDIASIEQLGGRAKAAMDAANPEQAALMAELNKQAASDLALGGQLNAGEQRQLSQAARGAQAARGFGYGINDAAIESWAQMQGSDQRRRQRQGFAQSMVGLNQSTATDPFMAILGRPSSVNPGMMGGLVNQAQGFNPGAMYSPESAYAQNIYGGNYQGTLAARTATANNRSAMMAGGLGAFGSILGA